jgi:hypothetical protein
MVKIKLHLYLHSHNAGWIYFQNKNETRPLYALYERCDGTFKIVKFWRWQLYFLRRLYFKRNKSSIK